MPIDTTARSPFCGAAGIAPGLGITADMFVVGAYVAGVTQAEYDAASSVAGLIEQRIKPALDDARRREQFEAMMIDLTGGRRSFDREGFRDEEETNWTRAAQLVAARLVPPRTAPYTFREEVGVSNDEFNGMALHIPTNDEAFRQFTAGMEVTGNLRMPLLTMHTTGDGQSPIGQAVELRRVVDAAGRSDLLVQRVIEDPGHCGFTTGEQEAALRALVDWAEHGRMPPGTDLSNEDLIALDRTFELVPRENEDDAEQEASAGRQAIIRGSRHTRRHTARSAVDRRRRRVRRPRDAVQHRAPADPQRPVRDRRVLPCPFGGMRPAWVSCAPVDVRR